MLQFSLTNPGPFEIFVSGMVGSFIPIFLEFFHGKSNRVKERIKNNPRISKRKAYIIEIFLIIIFILIGGFISMIFASTVSSAILIALGLESFLSKYIPKKKGG